MIPEFGVSHGYPPYCVANSRCFASARQTWYYRDMDRPKTVSALLSSGGVKAQIARAAREEAEHWLKTLQSALRRRELDQVQQAAVETEIRILRRKLRIRPTIDEVRAQAKARARRYYQRKRQKQ